jgi:hypothetical protein
VSRNATEEEIKSALYHGRIAVDAQLLEMTRFASGAVVYDYFSPSPIDDFVEREVMVRATTQSPVYITQEMVADGMD